MESRAFQAHLNLFKRLFKKRPPTPPVRPGQILDAGTGWRSFSSTAQITTYADAVFDRMAYADGTAKEMHIPEPSSWMRGRGGRKLAETMRPSKGDLPVACLDLGKRWDIFG